jgi:hypothetical protein
MKETICGCVLPQCPADATIGERLLPLAKLAKQGLIRQSASGRASRARKRVAPPVPV